MYGVFEGINLLYDVSSRETWWINLTDGNGMRRNKEGKTIVSGWDWK